MTKMMKMTMIKMTTYQEPVLFCIRNNHVFKPYALTTWVCADGATILDQGSRWNPGWVRPSVSHRVPRPPAGGLERPLGLGGTVHSRTVPCGTFLPPQAIVVRGETRVIAGGLKSPLGVGGTVHSRTVPCGTFVSRTAHPARPLRAGWKMRRAR